MNWLLAFIFLIGSHSAAYGVGAYHGDKPQGHGMRWVFGGLTLGVAALVLGAVFA